MAWSLELQPVGDLLMQLRTQLARDRVVGDVPDQRVVEAKCVFSREGRGSLLDEISAGQLEEKAADGWHFQRRRQMEDRAVPEVAPHNARPLQNSARHGVEPVESTREQGGE